MELKEIRTVAIFKMRPGITDSSLFSSLSSGKFGQVFRMSHKESGEVCAGKFYQARTSKDKKAARKEIELMNFLHHPKIVQCLAAYDTRSEMVMVME